MSGRVSVDARATWAQYMYTSPNVLVHSTFLPSFLDLFPNTYISRLNRSLAGCGSLVAMLPKHLR